MTIRVCVRFKSGPEYLNELVPEAYKWYKEVALRNPRLMFRAGTLNAKIENELRKKWPRVAVNQKGAILLDFELTFTCEQDVVLFRLEYGELVTSFSTLV